MNEKLPPRSEQEKQEFRQWLKSIEQRVMDRAKRDLGFADAFPPEVTVTFEYPSHAGFKQPEGEA